MITLYRATCAIFLSLFAISSFSADPVSLTIQTGAGGLLHKYALELSPAFSNSANSPLVIEFRPGGNGSVANQHLANDKSTNLSLLFGFAQSDVGIDQLTDITPVLDIGTAPVLVVANPTLGVKSLKDLVNNPPKRPITFGVAAGSVNNDWIAEFVKNNKHIEFIVVPYKTGTAAITDVTGGHIDLSITSVQASLPLIQDGKITALAVLSPHRSSLIDVPTPREQGIRYPKDTVGFIHFFLWANPNADKDVVDKFRKNYAAWSKTAEAAELFKKMDIGVNQQLVAKPETSLRAILGK